MARTYKRDKNGRFASTGSPSRVAAGMKGAGTRAKNNAIAAGMRERGLRKVGGRLQKKVASKFEGAAKTKKHQAELMGSASSANRASVRIGRRGNPGGMSGAVSGKASIRAKNTENRARAANRARSKVGSAGKPRTAPAPVTAAKATYKKLRSEQRAARRYSANLGGKWGGENLGAQASAATRKLRNFEKNRGVTSKPKARRKRKG